MFLDRNRYLRKKQARVSSHIFIIHSINSKYMLTRKWTGEKPYPWDQISKLCPLQLSLLWNAFTLANQSMISFHLISSLQVHSTSKCQPSLLLYCQHHFRLERIRELYTSILLWFSHSKRCWDMLSWIKFPNKNSKLLTKTRHPMPFIWLWDDFADSLTFPKYLRNTRLWSPCVFPRLLQTAISLDR